MHACALAEELSIGTVLVPRAGGVLSALGLAISDIRRDYAAPLLADIANLDPDRLATAWSALATRARTDLGSEARSERLADLRYRGQSYELTVAGADPAGLAAAFHAAHQQRYGHRAEDEPVEIVAVRLVATLPGEQPAIVEPDPPEPAPAPGRRDVLLDGAWSTVDVHDRAGLGRGSRLTGPAIVEFAESTCLLRLGWAGSVDGIGTLVLIREG
jgi:N-methylhydantoinase A